MPGVPPLVALIMSSPGMAARLADQHTDDGTGRCRSCTQGGQSGRVSFPCSIRAAVNEARNRSARKVVAS